MGNEENFLAKPCFPLNSEVVLQCVCAASNALQKATFGQWHFSELNPGTQVVCGILHELIVKEFSMLSDWRAGEPKKEPDVVNENDPQKGFEVKTSSSLRTIASKGIRQIVAMVHVKELSSVELPFHRTV